MKFIRFLDCGVQKWGRLEEDTRVVGLDGSPFGEMHDRPEEYPPVDELELLPPAEPTKIVCVGINYRDHMEEMGHRPPDEPQLFLKPPSALLGHKGTVLRPPVTNLLHYEGELAIIIGRQGKDIHPGGAPHFILGYSCLNDVTARDIQKSDVQWTRGKGFDTFAPLGPCIETELDPGNLPLKTILNGQVRQESNTSNMTFSPYFLVSYISRIMTLMPGDIIATGTPAGVGELRPGDRVEVRIEGIGTLVNRIDDPPNGE